MGRSFGSCRRRGSEPGAGGVGCRLQPLAACQVGGSSRGFTGVGRRGAAIVWVWVEFVAMVAVGAAVVCWLRARARVVARRSSRFAVGGVPRSAVRLVYPGDEERAA